MNTTHRRLIASMATGVLLAGSAAPGAWAARSEHIVNTIYDISCVFETAESDLVFFGASGSSSSGESGSFLFVETLDGEMILNGDGGTAVFGDDGSFSAEVDVISAAAGEAVGTATVDAVRTVVGEPVTEDVRGRSGNAWAEKGTVTTTDYRVEVVSVSVPGYSVQPSDDDCTSQDLAFDVRTTNPAGAVYRDTGLDSDICELDGLEFGAVRLSGTPREPTFEVVIDDGAAPQKASGTIALRGGSGRATAPLIDLVTEQAIAELAISVDLARSGTRQTETESFGGVTTRTARTHHVATIEVSTDDGRAGTAECHVVEYTETIIIRPGSGGEDT